MDEMRATQLGIVGSPSDTSEITIDIMESAEATRIRGQMVYLVLPHDNRKDRRARARSAASRRKTDGTRTWPFGASSSARGAAHLSGRADVRTATLTVQAAFTIDVSDDDGEEFCQEDMLGTSPGTGAKVYAVRDECFRRCCTSTGTN
jgi:hypothetical protein